MGPALFMGFLQNGTRSVGSKADLPPRASASTIVLCVDSLFTVQYGVLCVLQVQYGVPVGTTEQGCMHSHNKHLAAQNTVCSNVKDTVKWFDSGCGSTKQYASILENLLDTASGSVAILPGGWPP